MEWGPFFGDDSFEFYKNETFNFQPPARPEPAETEPSEPSEPSKPAEPAPEVMKSDASQNRKRSRENCARHGNHRVREKKIERKIKKQKRKCKKRARRAKNRPIIFPTGKFIGGAMDPIALFAKMKQERLQQLTEKDLAKRTRKGYQKALAYFGVETECSCKNPVRANTLVGALLEIWDRDEKIEYDVQTFLRGTPTLRVHWIKWFRSMNWRRSNGDEYPFPLKDGFWGGEDCQELLRLIKAYHVSLS